MSLVNTIKDFAEELFPEVLRIRRHLHKYPELSFNEYKTSEYICKLLDDARIKYRSGIAGTGIVASLSGEKAGGRIIALRADMDALPIFEENKVEYKSVNPGVMHACGHDVHSASLIGAAMILQKLSDRFEGTIKFIFQPGEEKAPGGAKLMLEDNLFDGEEPELILAQHVYPSMPVGEVGFRGGDYMASSDEIYMTVKGKGGHAAMPHNITDTVLIASHIIVALQQIVSRNAEASIPTVLSFGKFIANGAVNVIPSEVKIEGTFRTMNEEWRKDAHNKMKKLAGLIAKSMGGSCELKIVSGYPVLRNDPGLTLSCSQLAAEYLGKDKVNELGIRMTAEDFSFFAQKYPAVLYRLGVKNREQKIPFQLHSSDFNIEEEALKTGMGMLAFQAVSRLL